MTEDLNQNVDPTDETQNNSSSDSTSNASNESQGESTSDAQNTSSGSKSVSYIPQKDFDVLILAKEVTPRWIDSAYTLGYITTDAFQMMVDTYEVKLADGRSAKADRTPTVERLKQLRLQIDNNIGKIKDMLSIDYDKSSAPAHYPNFGIEKVNSTYTVPYGYDETKRGLAMLLQGLDKYGYSDYKYGKAFWQAIYDEYTSLETKNRALTGSTSALSGDKNVLKEQVSTVLRSILHLLQANFPATWEQVAREWGFLRERY
jgi:hypothetical protein